MQKQLETYLEVRFYKENHSKYHKYFREWLSGVTDNQTMYYQKEMNNIIK